MIRLDRDPGEAPGACYFGGFVGSLFGGGSSSSTTTASQSTNVNVEVNPQIDVAVDTGPVAEAVSGAVRDVAVAGQATAQQLAASLAQQNATVATGFERIGETIGENFKLAIGAALAVFVAWRMVR